jgi:hypothetical protein
MSGNWDGEWKPFVRYFQKRRFQEYQIDLTLTFLQTKYPMIPRAHFRNGRELARNLILQSRKGKQVTKGG